MNGIILYRPFKSHAWFLPFVMLVAILAFVAAGYCLPHVGAGIFCAAMGVAGAYLTKVLYDTSNIAVVFEQEGLRIIGGSYNDYRYFHWEEVSNAYYVRNFRGFLFLVLSPRELSPKEAKKLANRGANLSRICIDRAVVIHVDDLQNTSQLKEVIDKHLLHVDTY